MEVGLKSVCNHLFTKAADHPSESASTDTRLNSTFKVQTLEMMMYCKYILRNYYVALAVKIHYLTYREQQ